MSSTTALQLTFVGAMVIGTVLITQSHVMEGWGVLGGFSLASLLTALGQQMYACRNPHTPVQVLEPVVKTEVQPATVVAPPAAPPASPVAAAQVVTANWTAAAKDWVASATGVPKSVEISKAAETTTPV